ncbi:MAG TPA: cytochrome c biogenesis protein ResB [Candidatus Limnocylindrales bacterium]
MAQHVRARPLPQGSLEAEAPRQSLVGPLEGLLDGLWRILTSMRIALVLILAFAVLSLVGTVVVQAPPGTLADPQAKADWLGQVRPKYGGWTGIMDTLQAFAIFQSLWFRVVVAGLSISLVACSVHRIQGLWRTAARPRVKVADRFFEHAPQHETILAPSADQAALARLQAVLKRHRYRSLVKDEDGLSLYADRNRWGPMGSLVGHLSLLVILVGAVVGSTFGYRDSSFIVAEGSTAPVATDGLSVKLVSFKDSYYADTGEPSDYASDVILYKDGQQVGRQTVRVNQPLRYGDISFYQSFFGPAAVMTVTDASGKQVYSGGVPLAWNTNDGAHRVGTFALSAAGLSAWVVESAGADDTQIRPGQVQLELYQSSGDGQAVASQVLDQGKATKVGDLTYTFQREKSFTGLIVSRDPGAPLVWLGALLLVGGFVLVFMFPHRRLWARITPRKGGSTISLAAIGRHDTTVGREFTDLVADIRQALQTPAKG